MSFRANSAFSGSPGPMPGLPRYGPSVEPIAPPSPARGSHRCEVGAVEDVEHVRAELRAYPLSNRRGLEEGHVDRGVAGVVVLPAARGRIGVDWSIHRNAVGLNHCTTPPLMACETPASDSQPPAPRGPRLPRCRWDRCGDHRVRRSAVEREAGVDLPALHQPLRSLEGGNVVIEIAGKRVADVEVGVPVFRAFVEWILRNIGQAVRSHSRANVPMCRPAAPKGYGSSARAAWSAGSCRSSPDCSALRQSLSSWGTGCNRAASTFGLARLAVPTAVGIDVEQAHQVRSLGAHIAKLPDHRRSKAVLHVQIQRLGVRRPEVRSKVEIFTTPCPASASESVWKMGMPGSITVFGNTRGLRNFFGAGRVQARTKDRDILRAVVLQNRLHIDGVVVEAVSRRAEQSSPSYRPATRSRRAG